MSEIDDRRQRAFEAYADHPHEEGGIETAIEVATQVKITDEAIEAAWDAQPVAAREAGEIDLDDMRQVIAVALAALGFEVVD